MQSIWRSYQHPQDWPALLDLLTASHEANLADSEFRSSELRALLTRPGFDHERHTRFLVDDRHQALAFGVLWRGKILGMLVHPRAYGAVESSMVDWAVSVAGTAAGVMIRDDNAFARRMLESRGFTVRYEELRMVRDLHESISAPDLQDGFSIRALRGVDELPSWVALYNHAFGDTDIPGPTTVERWRAKLADPDYVPELNLVVVDEHDEIVSMCYCSLPGGDDNSMTTRQGRTEPIATHAGVRRRGLARAAILTGLNLLRDHGMDQALLTTDGGNVSAHRLYESLGYNVTYRALWYFCANRDN